jgi:1-acyl-sn-glycerol-3-phosphate acyltransferase
MIRANKEGPFSWLVARYASLKVRRTFRAVWVRGELPPVNRGTLIYANHSSFWDGLIIHALSRVAGWDGHCLMEEPQLRRYSFLSRIGAFSIRRGDPASALETLRYARTLLAGPRAVLLFPEGNLHSEPLPRPLERGIEVLAKAASTCCLPIALRYAFFEHELPDVLVEVGEPHPPTSLSGFSERLHTLVGRVGLARSPEGFRAVLRGRRGIAERWGVRGLLNA